MFDTHTHLNDDKLFPEWQSHIENFIKTGGNGLVNVAVNAERALRAKHIIEKTQELQSTGTISETFMVGATIGIHPSEACFGEVTYENIENEIDNIKNIFDQSPSTWRAIGECGIDLHYSGATETIQLQQELLAQQCQLAVDTGLPLVIHSRDGFPETIDILSQFASYNIATVFHCFGYGPKEAEYILSHFSNIYFGFDGNITYPKAEPLRETLMLIPNDKILLETDAPYLAPQGLRGTINTPTNVKSVYEYTAQQKNLGLYERETIIDQNVSKFYNKEIL